MASPIVVIGTGTGVGKTHVGTRLLRALGALGQRAYGYKPIESGVEGPPELTDSGRLTRASSFHVKQEPLRYVYREPVSPHLAARAAGSPIDLDAVRGEIARLAGLVERLVVELPGGAFSPVTDDVLCADLARSIRGAVVLLVTVDRLGVLHDVGASARACAATGLPLRGVIFNASPERDASVGRNAAELHRVTTVPLLAELPREDADAPIPPGHPAHDLARLLMR